MTGSRPPAEQKNVVVFGAGAWGGALAQVAATAGNRVTLIGRDADAMRLAAKTRELPRLPGIPLSPAIRLTGATESIDGADILLLVVPAQALRDSIAGIAATIATTTRLVVCAKGIERTSGLLLTEMVEEALPFNPLAVLSGPGFAVEVSRGLPTAVTIAARQATLAHELARDLANPTFRPYSSTDLIGVQLGGALKNVLAIASGVVDGLKLGASAEAAVITRGFVEMRRLAAAWGAHPDTMLGLSGFGDLMLTCRSTLSRNFSYGRALGQGLGRDNSGGVIEGQATAAIAEEKAHAFGLDVPIMSAVAATIAGRISVAEAIESLLARPLKHEDNL